MYSQGNFPRTESLHNGKLSKACRRKPADRSQSSEMRAQEQQVIANAHKEKWFGNRPPLVPPVGGSVEPRQKMRYFSPYLSRKYLQPPLSTGASQYQRGSFCATTTAPANVNARAVRPIRISALIIFSPCCTPVDFLSQLLSISL